VSGDACVVYVWVSSTLATSIYHSGLETRGGFGDFTTKLEYEFFPQEVRRRFPSAARVADPQTAIVPDVARDTRQEKLPVRAGGRRARRRFFLSQPGSVQGVREWLRGLGKNLWTFEPLEDAPASASPQHSAEDAKILRFLDNMRTKHGERSVISVRCPLFSCTLLKEM
jgi:hypothetical protein